MDTRRRATVLAVIVAAAAGWRCGFAATGTGPPAGTADASDDIDPSGLVDGGPSSPTEIPFAPLDGSASVDAADAADAGRLPCTVCSTACPEACPACTTGDRYCIASASCGGDCDSCSDGPTSCYVCSADGGSPRRVCGSRTSGFCGLGLYTHCPCTTEADCNGTREVCAGGTCRLCGEPASGGLKCKGCDNCNAASGCSNCP